MDAFVEQGISLKLLYTNKTNLHKGTEREFNKKAYESAQLLIPDQPWLRCSFCKFKTYLFKIPLLENSGKIWRFPSGILYFRPMQFFPHHCIFFIIHC